LKELGLEWCVDGIDAQKVFGYAMYKDKGEAKAGPHTRPLLSSTRAVLVTEPHQKHTTYPTRGAHVEPKSGRA
jgi:hypothetical protein